LSQAVAAYKLTAPTYDSFFSLDTASLEALRLKGITVASAFLLGDFLTMSISSNQSSSLKAFLDSINSGNTCDLFSDIF